MKASSLFMWDGQGPVMIGTYNPVLGRPDMAYLTDLYRIGCGTSQLTTEVTVETEKIRESCTGQRGVLKEKVVSREVAVTLSMYQFSGRTLAAALYGEAFETEPGTVTDEILAPLKPGDYFMARHRKIEDVVIEDSTASPVTYVLDTHYTIEDADHSRMRLIEHPASHQEPLKMDYRYGDYTNIRVFSQPQVERGIIFNGINGDGDKATLFIPRISLSLSGGFAWIGDENATLELSGSAMLVPELENDPQYGAFARVSLMGKAA